jgi:hypothetical protein
MVGNSMSFFLVGFRVDILVFVWFLRFEVCGLWFVVCGLRFAVCGLWVVGTGRRLEDGEKEGIGRFYAREKDFEGVPFAPAGV